MSAEVAEELNKSNENSRTKKGRHSTHKSIVGESFKKKKNGGKNNVWHDQQCREGIETAPRCHLEKQRQDGGK